jgi:ADP-ribose pyrophosphatase
MENLKNVFEEKTLSSTDIYRGSLLYVKKDMVTLPNKKTSTREFVVHPGAVAIVPVIDNNIVLVTQYRYPIKSGLLEIPAGKFDRPDEKWFECAGRELEEETGYRSEKFEYLGYIYTTPGFSDEKIHLCYTDKLGNGTFHPDEDEFLNVVKIPIDRVYEMCLDGSITDAKTVVAVTRTIWHLNKGSR